MNEQSTLEEAPKPEAVSVKSTMLSEQDVRQRLARLSIEKKAAERTVDAYTGAIQEAEFWLGVVIGEHAATDSG